MRKALVEVLVKEDLKSPHHHQDDKNNLTSYAPIFAFYIQKMTSLTF